MKMMSTIKNLNVSKVGFKQNINSFINSFTGVRYDPHMVLTGLVRFTSTCLGEYVSVNNMFL